MTATSGSVAEASDRGSPVGRAANLESMLDAAGELEGPATARRLTRRRFVRPVGRRKSSAWRRGKFEREPLRHGDRKLEGELEFGAPLLGRRLPVDFDFAGMIDEQPVHGELPGGVRPEPERRLESARRRLLGVEPAAAQDDGVPGGERDDAGRRRQ